MGASFNVTEGSVFLSPGAPPQLPSLPVNGNGIGIKFSTATPLSQKRGKFKFLCILPLDSLTVIIKNHVSINYRNPFYS
jgi:hypothetical protein